MKNKIFIYGVLLFFIAVCTYKIVDICIIKHDYYYGEYEKIVNKTITGTSAPRGRILDINGTVLVDNTGINTIIYNSGANLPKNELLELVKNLAKTIEVNTRKLSEMKLKTYYLVTHNDGKNLITKNEYDLYEKRKLKSDEIEALKYERVTEDMLNTLTLLEREEAIIYSSISSGYSYQDKTIKTNATDEEVALLSEMNLPGIRCILTWERTYPYGDVLRSIFGSVSTNEIPLELKDYYVSKGLKMDSTVGVSYLEYQYDEYLRGKDAVYKLNQNNRVELISEEKRGNDLYLSIDIETQLKTIDILKEEMINAKKAKNSEYYNHSYVIVGHPKTGEIVAMVGLQINGDHFVDITSNIINNAYTVGSVVKRATISVGYANNLITPDAYVTDGCIKVYGVTEKCSLKSLGRINDLTALAQSSNYFQFLIATRLTNPAYKWNSKLNATSEHFKIYRDTLASYGLGTTTGIDLPNEKTGIIGKTISDDLLLNLTIGQYDTYTPIELF